MHTKRAKSVFSNDVLTIVAIEKAVTQSQKWDFSCGISSVLEPVAVVVCEERNQYALDMNAEPIDIDQLKKDVPELDHLLTDSSCN